MVLVKATQDSLEKDDAQEEFEIYWDLSHLTRIPVCIKSKKISESDFGCYIETNIKDGTLTDNSIGVHMRKPITIVLCTTNILF
jgi:hypothetical protein